MSSIPGKTLNQFGLKDLAGQKFGMLTVISVAPKQKDRHAWFCVCDCGTKLIVRHDYLLHTNSPKRHCGCANKGPSALHPLEYAVWSMMLVRTSDPNHVSYRHYGGRGIKVCERWQDFNNFLEDMGPRKSREFSIERANNDMGYQLWQDEACTVRQCTWVKKKHQGRNRRNTIYLEHPKTGLRVPAAEVAEYLKVSYQAMRARYISEGRWPTVQDVPPTKVEATNADKNDSGEDSGSSSSVPA